MANDELNNLLQALQGTAAGRMLNPGLPSALNLPAGGDSKPATAITSAAGSGLTLLPIVGGLLRLFGAGREKAEPAPFEKFTLPESVRTEAGLNASGEMVSIDRGAGDRIRLLGGPSAETRSTETPASTPLTAPADTKPTAGATITVNVQAMDSQSFMDRREDIARAVREAMLQSHSLNDVVNDL